MSIAIKSALASIPGYSKLEESNRRVLMLTTHLLDSSPRRKGGQLEISSHSLSRENSPIRQTTMPSRIRSARTSRNISGWKGRSTRKTFGVAEDHTSTPAVIRTIGMLLQDSLGDWTIMPKVWRIISKSMERHDHSSTRLLECV